MASNIFDNLALHELPFHNHSLISEDNNFDNSSCNISFNSSQHLFDTLIAPHPRALHVIHINAEGLLTHFGEISNIISNARVHVMMISESHMKSFIPQNLVEIPGYNLARNDRCDSMGGGGVAMYIREDLKYKIIHNSNADYSQPEFMFAEIIVNFQKIFAAVVYRHPRVSNITLLEDSIIDFLPNYENCIICGDFNSNLLVPSARKNEIMRFADSCNMTILQLNATYQHSPLHNATWLDLLLCNKPEKILTHGQMDGCGISKHDIIFLSYSVRTSKFKPKLIQARNIKSINHTAFKADADAIPWLDISKLRTVDDMAEKLNSLIIELYDKHAPLRTIRVTKPAAPWITDDIKLMMNKRDKAKRTWRRDKTPANWERFREFRNRAKQLQRNARVAFSHKKLNPKLPARPLWNNIRSMGLIQSKAQTCSEISTADNINLHFVKISYDLNSEEINNTISDLLRNTLPPECEEFSFHPVTMRQVRSAFFKIKTKARGHDALNTDLLHPIIRQILPVLTRIINTIIASGRYPVLWKKSIVVPLPKKSNPSIPDDLRPISIVPVMSKIAEHIIDNQIEFYLTDNKLLSIYQSGFRNKHSTCTALVDISDMIRFAKDSHKLSLLILLDYSNAFPSMNHRIFAAILEAEFKFSPAAVALCLDFLAGRFQSVSLNNTLSSWLAVKAGVAQGTVPAPRFFTMYINKLLSVITEGRAHCYADDLQLFYEFSPENAIETIKKVNADISRLSEIGSKRFLKLNALKTQAIIIGNTIDLERIDLTHLPPICIDEVPVPYLNKVKNLGIIMNSTFNWDDHISTICKRVMGCLFTLNRCRRFIPDDLKKQIIQSLVFPHFYYCDVVLHDVNAKQARRLQLLLHACARFVFNLKKYDHITAALARLNWPSLDKIRDFHLVNMVYNCIHDPNYPTYLTDRLILLSKSHTRATRSAETLCLKIPNYNMSSFSNSFSVSAARLWNNLPVKLRKAPTASSFKRAYSAKYL